MEQAAMSAATAAIKAFETKLGEATNKEVAKLKV